MDIYKFAAQNRLRFSSVRGDLTAEQLFQLPLRSGTGFDLDTVARAINAGLKEMTEESFVEDTAANPQKEALRVGLEVVKDVIATKQAENRATRTRMENAAQRKKILDAISAKKDEKLTQSTIEDLEKQLAALEV